MKHLRKFNEDRYPDNWDLDWLIGTYSINSDGLTDVVGDVDFSSFKTLTKLPIKFGKVSGNFNCSLNLLTTLEGCPIEVGGNFTCYTNNLTNLKGCPKIVGNNFYCSRNIITSLEGCPDKITGIFDCSHNLLTSLIGCPDTEDEVDCSSNKLVNLIGSPKILSILDCYNNKLTSLEGCPSDMDDMYCYNNIKLYDLYGCGNFVSLDISNCPVHEIFKLCQTNEFAKYLNEFRPIRPHKEEWGGIILGKRLQECLYMCDKEDIDVSKLRFNYYELLE